MKLFKAQNLPKAGVVSYDRGELEDFPLFPQAPEEEIVEEVEEEEKIDVEALRAEVLAAAREEAAELVQQAYQEGLRRGEEAGRAAFEARVAGLAEMFEACCAEMQAARERFLEELEPQVVELVVLAARRTLQREMAGDATLLQTTVRRALAKLTDRQCIVVRLNPGDLQTVRDERVALLEEFHGVEEMHIVGDEGIEAGSCVIDSETMQADARLEKLLDDILAQLWS